MRLTRDKLIVLGIAALHEAAERATAEPMRPGLALRAVLAMLYALGDGDRTPFDGFWRALRDRELPDHPQRAYLRATSARTAIEGILRSLGCEGEELLRHYVSRVLHGPPSRPWKPYDEKIAWLERQRRGDGE